MLHALSSALTALPYPPLAFDGAPSALRRKGLRRPPTSTTFVRPLRQSFIKDARLAPGTTRMLCLIAGWGGRGDPIDTTLGIIGRHLQRSPRQVQRYLKDAAEEGYLAWSKVTNRLGYVIGLRIRLNGAAIFAPNKARSADAKTHPRRRTPATTQMSDTKTISSSKGAGQERFERKLREICQRNDIPWPPG